MPDVWKITNSAAGQTVDKNYDPYDTAYQKNMKQTQAPKAQTVRDVMGQLYNINAFDSVKANEGFDLLMRLQQDKTSKFYNP